MKKTLLPLVTVAALLAMPIGQAWAAPKPTPPVDNSGGQMNMSASQMAASQPAMDGWDMVQMRTTAAMRAKAARNARAKGKPAQAVAVNNFDPAKGPDYFGTTPNYANSPLPHITWKTTAGSHTAGENVILPLYDPTTRSLLNPLDGTSVIDVCSADSPYQIVAVLGFPGADTPTCANRTVDGGSMRVGIDPINKVPQLDMAKVNISGGIRKFIEPLPSLLAPTPGSKMLNYDKNKADPKTAYIPVATPDKVSYPGTDYYEIGLTDYYQTFSPDLAPTKLRGYYQENDPTLAASRPYYLGPVILATSGTPVRIKFTNHLPTGSGGDLFIPTDTTAMGAGMGPDGVTPYGQNRATLHLHGGLTPWISDGTPHQWTTPVGDDTKYPKGVSVVSVPDMAPVQTVNMDGTKKAANATTDGSLTFYYTNFQNARLMWYHDHAYGLTRLNVYAGEVAGYVLTDPAERGLVDAGTIPGNDAPGGEGIPLIIQDKTFVPDDDASGYFNNGQAPGQLSGQDPTWNTATWGGKGSLWFPHVYMPNQNPYDNSGANAMGRWDYGPWFWPIFGKSAGLQHGEIPNPYATAAMPWEPPMIPGTPSTYTLAKHLATSDVSLVPEAFVDTPVVNGVAYPYLSVDPKAYRFRILNGANDRFFNLQMYCSAADKPNAALGLYKVVDTRPMWASTDPNTMPQNPAAGEVPMVPAVQTDGYPANWPTDGRAGGVPDPAAAAGHFLQIGTESGVLPNVVEVNNSPVGYNYNRRDIVVLNIDVRALTLGPAERADVVYDFSVPKAMGCNNVILYNDAPAPVPAFDPRNDYYTNNPDLTDSGGAPSTLPGYGPNTRTIMQFRISGATAVPFDAAKLQAAIPKLFSQTQHKPITPETRYAAAYPGDPIGTSDAYSRIQDNNLSFVTSTAGQGADLQLVSGGSGYAPKVTITRAPTDTVRAGDPPRVEAQAVPIIGRNGIIAGITVVNPGTLYRVAPTVTVSTPMPSALVPVPVTATAIAVRGTAGTTRNTITGITMTNRGSGYSSGATLIIDAAVDPVTLQPTGFQATGSATVDLNTGAVSAVTLTQSGNGYTTAPNVTISDPLYVGGVKATAIAIVSTKSAKSITVKMEPKAIQELFEMDYGRMNATLGVELPFTNAANQTTLPLGYAEPVTEFMKPSDMGQQIGSTRDGTEIWKITHNGVDSHTIHFHLSDVQLVNRVGWDGAIRPPDDNELGWKESVRMNPLEDAIVAMRPETPPLPFKIGDSIRPIDPSMPIGHPTTFLNPKTGQADVIDTNQPTNLGWEYVWHCHLLGHEENDMMRPVDFAGSPVAPTILGAASAAPGTATVTWQDNGNWTVTNFVVQRADNRDFTGAVQTLSDRGAGVGPLVQPWQGSAGSVSLGGVVPATASSFPDSGLTAGTYYYRVRAESANGFSQWSDSASVTVN
jgi:FtsP/CotA-like multicopper oxidase with cupredoxin domain